MITRSLDQLLSSRTPRGGSGAWLDGTASDLLGSAYLDGPERYDGRVKWWAGAGWRSKPLKRWDGAQWVEVEPKWFRRGEWLDGPAAPPAPPIALVQKSAPWEALNRASLNNVSPGSCVIVFLSRYEVPITGVAGAVGGAYELLYRSNDFNTAEIWAKFDHPGGAETITCTGGDYISGGALEFSGVARTSALAAGGTPRGQGEMTSRGGLVAGGENPVSDMLELAVGGVWFAADDNGLILGRPDWTLAFMQSNSNAYTGSISGFKIASEVETAGFRAVATTAASITGVILTLRPGS